MVDSAREIDKTGGGALTKADEAPKPAVKLSGKTKSAILMVAMGTDYAAQVYKHLGEEEIEMLTLEIATLPNIDSDSTNTVLGEFYEMCVAQKYIVEGGMDYARDALEKAFGAARADTIISKVSSSIGSKPFSFLKKADPKQLFNFIQHEYPQTIALILAYATKEQAATITSMLPKQKQIAVIERIAKMDRPSPEIIKEVEDVLKNRIASLASTEIVDNLGGVKHTAELLNSVDRGTQRYIFDELAKKDEELVTEIRNLMFVFDDITTLDNFAMQRLAKDIDPKDLVIALKNANKDIQEAFFNNISKRSAELIKEDMQYAKNIRARDVEAAQARIVNKVRELEELGQIVISRGKDDELV